jgi:hypothetical protein
VETWPLRKDKAFGADYLNNEAERSLRAKRKMSTTL